MITQPQRTTLPYELDDDIVTGFRTAVANNQVSLALQYAVLLFARQDKRIFEMEEEVKEATKSKSSTSTAKSTSSKSSSSRSRKQDDEE